MCFFHPSIPIFFVSFLRKFPLLKDTRQNNCRIRQHFGSTRADEVDGSTLKVRLTVYDFTKVILDSNNFKMKEINLHSRNIILTGRRSPFGGLCGPWYCKQLTILLLAGRRSAFGGLKYEYDPLVLQLKILFYDAAPLVP